MRTRAQRREWLVYVGLRRARRMRLLIVSQLERGVAEYGVAETRIGRGRL